jgi:hypothetical protein
MPDRVLFIGWGTPVRGAEERAIEAFNEAMGLLGRMQQDGRIESFDVVWLEPNSDLDGFVVAHGSAEQIASLRADPEFRRSTVNAQLSVDGIRHIEGVANEGIAGELAMYQEAIASIPQRG